MKIHFLRHGLAQERPDWKGDDSDRPLTDQGRERMERSAAAIARFGLDLDAILTSPLARAHVGIYAFTGAFLQRFASLPPGRLEVEESLEQLRALENGIRIRVADTAYRGFGIDTPEDLERARALLGPTGN